MSNTKPSNLIFIPLRLVTGGNLVYLQPNWASKAYTLVDLGHHLPNANIEQIVSLLINGRQTRRISFQR